MAAESPGRLPPSGCPEFSGAEDLANNDTETAKWTFSPKVFCPLLGSNLEVDQARSLCRLDCKHEDQTKKAVKKRNLHKAVLNQTKKGEINSPDCLNNYKDGMKCHISCIGRPSIKDFFKEYQQIAQVMLLLQDIRIETCKPISQILFANNDLLLQLLTIIKTMFNIKSFCSTINRIQNNDKAKISIKLIKKFALFCFQKDLWPHCWLNGPTKDISIKSCCKEIESSLYFYNTEKEKLNTGILQYSPNSYTAIFKRCSDYSILPFIIYKQLSVHYNKLNTTICYNVTDDTTYHRDAVIGTYSFKLRRPYEEQPVFHTFLVLRQHICFDQVILGADFCKAQNVS